MTRKRFKKLTGVAGAAMLTAATLTSLPVMASEPFIGTIKYFGFNFAPRGWAQCDGQLLAISSNNALFALLGTTYGGDGRTTFALPDMRGRLPVHFGQGPGLSNRPIGQRGGAEQVTLTANQAGHSHALRGTTGEGNQTVPTGHALAQDGTDNTYRNETPTVAMAADSLLPTGGGQAHENRSPFLTVNCNIALFGIFPSRS